jgi:hypothetical protein
LGVAFGVTFLERRDVNLPRGLSKVNSFAAMDGAWYSAIARDGYQYSSEHGSPTAFFPAYPLFGAAVSQVTGLREDLALVVVSHACLLGSFALLHLYLSERSTPADLALAAMALWPMTFFFRMAYTESLFVLLLLVALWGMQRAWSPAIIAVVCGMITATRPTGMAVLLPFLCFIWRQSRSGRKFLIDACCLVPLACWGILAYMCYLRLEFGSALAFAQTQQHWQVVPELGWSDYIVSLVTLEPIWSVYDSESWAYWANYELHHEPLLSIQFANPVWFCLIALLVTLGAAKKWLNIDEVLLSAGLLLIPYLTHAQPTAFAAEGRYAAAVFPAYIVLGRLGSYLPPALLAPTASLLGTMLAMYTALFVAWYRIL